MSIFFILYIINFVMPVFTRIKFLNVFRQNNIELHYGPFSVYLPWHSILHGNPRYFKEFLSCSDTF